MAIQARRGLKKDFDPNKLLPGEPAVPLDTREVYMAFAPGDVQKLATHENVKEMVEEATDEVIADFTEGVNNATEYATEQGDYAKMQGNHAKTQGDYAKVQGDYAKAQGQAAESIVLGNIATETTPGIVRGGGDVKVDPTTGDMTAPDKLEKTGDAKDNTVTFVQAEEDGELTSGSKLSALFGLIKKKFADILTSLAGKIDKTSIAQTTEVNDSTKVPSTAVTHGMQQNIVKNANDINTLNNNFAATNLNYHSRFNLTSGTIADAITQQMQIGFFGGEISLVGSYEPTDTYNKNTWGTIKWIRGSGTIAYLQFIVDRSASLITRSISMTESIDTGWVVH
ncbi:MAG: hypothetical protein E6600_04280 [Anaerocolumna aminovalerica]|uniref:hypothetical protein n=1 Tax=Anaerocolumna aminovalerica TaxID=1527 RepID=UPI00291233D9|nr:hypothetical protein [Anaerocolumna aminovalerica]MDU6263703.1 hypothetical protein [Anaerocolumna aminovalerica]